MQSKIHSTYTYTMCSTRTEVSEPNEYCYRYKVLTHKNCMLITRSQLNLNVETVVTVFWLVCSL